MAIYHLNAKMIQRSKGRNVISAAAYRRAARLWDEAEQRYWNYQSKRNVVHSEIIVPKDAPDWAHALVTLHETDSAQAASQLWNKANAAEKRVDAQLARELEFALPLELSQADNILLTRAFVQDCCARLGMIADWNMHWDVGNPHVHVMLTVRPMTSEGFGKKNLAWNGKSVLRSWRSQWAEYVNRYLSQHQHATRIDHRSYADQGIDLIPTLHQGKAVTDMEKRGIPAHLMQETRLINQENLSRIAADPAVILDKLAQDHETFTHAQWGQALGRYVNDKGLFSLQSQGIFSEALLKDAAELDRTLASQPCLTPEIIACILRSVEAHESVFTERDLAKAIAHYTDHSPVFTRALLQMKASPALLSLGVGEDGKQRFTTRRLFHLENALQTLAERMHRRQHASISDKRVTHLLQHHQRHSGLSLTLEQEQAVRRILEPSALRCLVGRAGTGKSFSLRMAKTLWESQGLRVQGVALSGIAAEALHQETGMLSSTLESFRYRLKQGHFSLHPGDVIVLDEAGMADSVSLHFLLEAAQTAKAKVVLVGDPAQLQPIGPGASFRALLERVGFADLQTVYRQSEPWQREATVAFSKGEVEQGLTLYADHNCVHFEASPEETLQRLVTDWLHLHRLPAAQQSIVIAHRNADVGLLNAAIRAGRVARGDIAEGTFTPSQLGPLFIAQGDRILLLKNDRGLGLTNGRFATVQAVAFSKSGCTRHFTVRLDGSETSVVIDPQDYPHFTYGYAATVHKIQGITVDHSFVYTEGFFWNRHLSYVALSRHRKSCHIYASKSSHRDQRLLTKHLGRLGLKDSVLDFPLAFAERRAIDSSGLVKILSRHLAKRLVVWQERLSQGFDHYLQRKKGRSSIEKTQTETLSAVDALDSVLRHYVVMEVELTRLVQVLYAERAKSHEAGRTASAQVQAHQKTLLTFVQQAIAQPEVKAALQALKAGSLSLAERGGFLGIYTRLQDSGAWLAEDMQVVLKALHRHSRTESRGRDQSRSRGGRSQ